MDIRDLENILRDEEDTDTLFITDHKAVPPPDPFKADAQAASEHADVFAPADVPPSIPQIPLPDFKKWEDPISSQLDYDEAPDELPMESDGITKHRSRILYFTDALVKKDD
jgi:hypothetical protein